MTKKLLIVISCITIALFTGCTVGPDYSRPETPADDVETFNNLPSSWEQTTIAEDVAPWWQRFADPVTAELVVIALENNNDIKAATARVLESQQMLNQAHGVRFPSVSYSASRYRGKSVYNSPAGSSDFLTTNYSQDISVSYMVDLFGKLRRAEQAAIQELYATESSRQALTHAIVAQVVSVRTRIATLQRLLSIAHATNKSREQTLDTVNRRYKEGLVGSVELYLARENLAVSKSSVPQIEQSLALAQNSLDVLLGRSPGSSADLAETLPGLPDLSPVPAGLPVDLLDKRPDIMQAEFQLAASTERIGISIAQMLPDFTLTASGGYTSDSFRLLTASENQIYSTVIGLATPIFQGGRLKAGVEAAKARTEQAAANYASVILNALREVEDALVSEQYLQQRLKELRYRFDQGKKAETLSRERYSQGVGSLLLVLETERRSRISENELASVEGELWLNRIRLFLALGGDWQMPTDTNENDTYYQTNIQE